MSRGRRLDLVVQPFFCAASCAWSYLLANPASGCCAVIDAALDVDARSGRLTTTSADALLAVVAVNGYRVEWILETHPRQASAGRYLKSRLICAQLVTGEGVVAAREDLAPAARHYDRLLADDQRLDLGHVRGRVLHTPGHSPVGVTYLFDGLAFVGDTLLMPDCGTGRCDLPGGNARDMYASVQRLYDLPEQTRLLIAHDYAPGSRQHRCAATVAEQRRDNRMLDATTTVEAFVEACRARDASLAPSRALAAAPGR